MGRKVSSGKWTVGVVVVLAVIAAGAFLTHRARHVGQSTPTAPVATAPVVTHSVATPIQHPIAQAQASPASSSMVALPTLDQSDADVLSALKRLAGTSELSSLLVRPQVISRIVASIDAMPGRSLGGVMMPAHTPKGAFVTRDVDGHIVMGEDNAARYAPYMQIVEQVDPQALVTWYVHAYPLFQRAYQNLGYPHGYFNDRLIVVIDNLLAAPEVTAAPVLQPAKGHYVYADPDLESRSAGQRLLLRTGPGNAAKIKAQLRTIRGLLIGQNLHPAVATTVAQPAAGASIH